MTVNHLVRDAELAVEYGCLELRESLGSHITIWVLLSYGWLVLKAMGLDEVTPRASVGSGFSNIYRSVRGTYERNC